MKESFNRLFWMNIITNTLLSIMGLFLLTNINTSENLISYLLGIILLFNGIFGVLKYYTDKGILRFYDTYLYIGIIGIVIGTIMIAKPSLLLSVIPFILGLWFVLSATTKSSYALELRNVKNPYWICIMTASVATFILGLIMVIDPFDTSMKLSQIVGVYSILYAIIDIIYILVLKFNIDDLKPRKSRKR